MKNLFDFKTNIRTLENIVRSMSKGYYSNFGENNPDHSEQEEINDHSQIEEDNDHFSSNEEGENHVIK